jgi:hypothetical protein
MKKQQSQHEPRRSNQVNNQRPRRESQPEFFSRHVGRALNAHELVTNNNPSIQETKEATGHSTGHQ